MPTTKIAGADAVNSKELLKVLTAFKKGDFSVRMPVDQAGPNMVNFRGNSFS